MQIDGHMGGGSYPKYLSRPPSARVAVEPWPRPPEDSASLRVARAGRVRVRELVDEEHLGAPPDRGVQVELGAADRGERLEAFQQGELRALVGVHDADHDVAPVLAHAVRGVEHGVGLAGAGKSAEEYLELAATRVRRH